MKFPKLKERPIYSSKFIKKFFKNKSQFFQQNYSKRSKKKYKLVFKQKIVNPLKNTISKIGKKLKTLFIP